MKSISELIPFEAIQERDMDLLILEEIKCNKIFIHWLVIKILGKIDEYQFIGAWHSLTKSGLGETDIAFKINVGEKSILFFIENKINATFQPSQASRYKLRGNEYINDNECDLFYTILMAPKRYLENNVDFDYYIQYEEIRDWFKNKSEMGVRGEYKALMFEIAIEKLRRGYTPIINDAVTQFRWSYFEYTSLHYSHLNMIVPKKELPKKTGFIRFKPLNLNLQKREFIIHKQRGDIDLQLNRFGEDMDEYQKNFNEHLLTEMSIVKTAKSVSIRIKCPSINIEKGFNEQVAEIEETLTKINNLYNWAIGYLQ
jgi:hypothetical protein